MSAFVVGIVLSIGVALFARLSGLDRDRAFYPTVLAVVASYYDLFGVIGGSTTALLEELGVTALFLAAVVVGYRRSLWIVAAALVAHGLLDLVHADVIANPGVPAWWPMFCMAYDVGAGAILAGMLVARDRPHTMAA